MNKFIIGLISLYQRYLSPYKGFLCAHAYWYQGDSCSVAVKTIIVEQGIIQGYTDIRHRFKAYRYAYEEILRDDKRKEEQRRKDREYVCDRCKHSCDIGSCVPDIMPCDCSL
jgi:hypothetical protein